MNKRYAFISSGKITKRKKPKTINFPDYDKIMQPKTVVYCDTEEKANKLLKWADSKGLTWCNGDSYLNDNQYNVFKDQTCYDLYDGVYGGLNNCKKYRATIIKI